MKYQKLTVEDFAKKLADGGYEHLTGARRAIGKTGWKDADKEKAKSLADAHFGAEAKAKPAATKKVAKKKVAKKPAPKKQAAAKSRKEAARAASPANDSEPTGTGLAAIHLVGETVGTINQAIMAMQKAKEAAPDVDITKGIQAAQNGLTGAVEQLNREVGNTSASKSNGHQGLLTPSFAEASPAAVGLPHASSD